MGRTPKDLLPKLVFKYSNSLSEDFSQIDPSQYKIVIKIPVLDKESKKIYKISAIELSQDRTELSSIVTLSNSIG